MTTTNFQNGVTLTDDDWFNDVDFLVYDIFGDSTTTASAAARIAPSITSLGAVNFTSVNVGGVASLSAVAGAAVATQAIMEAASSLVTIPPPGRLHFHPGVAKAWARFDGTATSVTAAASYGLTSITDNGTGSYTVLFSTSFSSNTNFAIIPSSSADITKLRSVSAGSATILCTGHAGTAEDSATVQFVAFGDFA
jgi:hypothetical protein